MPETRHLNEILHTKDRETKKSCINKTYFILYDYSNVKLVQQSMDLIMWAKDADSGFHSSTRLVLLLQKRKGGKRKELVIKKGKYETYQF